jgi:hypothetical protein
MLSGSARTPAILLTLNRGVRPRLQESRVVSSTVLAAPFSSADEFLIYNAGLPQRYRDSVRAIQPGLPLFLYNYTIHQLHGIFEVIRDSVIPLSHKW